MLVVNLYCWAAFCAEPQILINKFNEIQIQSIALSENKKRNNININGKRSRMDERVPNICNDDTHFMFASYYKSSKLNLSVLALLLV